MENSCKENEAKTLRQNVSMILDKKLKLWIRSNLTKDERRVLKELQRDDKLKLHEFDKRCGFAIVVDDTAKQKVEE